MQHYKKTSLEERGLKDVLGDKYDYFMEHIEVANHTKLMEKLEMKPWKFYRCMRMYRKQQANQENNNAQSV